MHDDGVEDTDESPVLDYSKRAQPTVLSIYDKVGSHSEGRMARRTLVNLMETRTLDGENHGRWRRACRVEPSNCPCHSHLLVSNGQLPSQM